MTLADVVPDGFDFTDPGVNEKNIPHDEFLALRQNAPVFWVEQEQGARDGMSEESGTGYYALSKHADVAAVSKDSKNFSTAENGAIIRFQEGMLREMVELQRVMLINQDAPEHTATRQIISRGFTPRAIGALDDLMKERAEKIVKDAVARGEGNFVEEVAAELPLQAIADFIGVPQEDRRKLFEWSNQMLSYDDPDVVGDPDVAAAEILGVLHAARRGPQGEPARRHRHQARARRQGRPRPDRRRVRLLRDHPDRGRQRDHPERDHPRHERLPRQPRPVGPVEARAARDHGRRGDPLGHPGQLLPADRTQRRRGRWRRGQEGPARRPVLRQRQLRRRRLRRTRTASTSPATRTRTSPSAATARTTASARTWPARRSS